jgi:hypothetical protein
VWTEHGQLRVEATIRDKSGAIVATMHGNEWTVNPHRIFDRNFSDTAVEVLDERGDVVFHVAMCTFGAVAEAIFHGEGGDSVAISSGDLSLHDKRPEGTEGKGPISVHIFPFNFKYSDTGTVIRRIGTDSDSNAYIEYGYSGERLITKLKPWFLYPSGQFLGQRRISESEICTRNAPSWYH